MVRKHLKLILVNTKTTSVAMYFKYYAKYILLIYNKDKTTQSKFFQDFLLC